MVLAGIVGMLTAFAVADTKLLELVKTMAPMPVPMPATMALAVQSSTIGGSAPVP
jgi:hypothetical protein